MKVSRDCAKGQSQRQPAHHMVPISQPNLVRVDSIQSKARAIGGLVKEEDRAGLRRP